MNESGEVRRPFCAPGPGVSRPGGWRPPGRQPAVPPTPARWLPLLCLLLLHACAVPKGPVYEKDGKRYGEVEGTFRGMWWNHYERGISYAEGGYWDEAIRDFNEALAGNDRDMRRTRTYGLHSFIEYFPHRELGAAYYRTGLYDDAARELERSVEEERSARAVFYLNQARRSILERDGLDSAPPRILLDSPREGQALRGFQIEVRGEARDDSYVQAVWIQDRPLPVDLARSTVSFRETVQLEPGEHEVRVDCEDLLGRRTTEIIHFRVDRDGPQVEIETMSCGEPLLCAEVEIRGYATDASGVAALSVGGVRIPVPAGAASVDFRQRVPVDPVTLAVAFEAEDVLGNATTGTLRVDVAARPEAHGGRPPAVGTCVALRAIGVPANDLGLGLLPARPAGARHRGPLPPEPRSRVASSRTPAKVVDESPPLIRLKDLSEEQQVYYDTLYVEGFVQDASPIAGLQLNGQSILHKAGKQFFFSHFVHLKPGPNRLTILAEDVNRNMAEKSIEIDYQVPSIHQNLSRLKLLILPFSSHEERAVPGEYVHNALTSAFLRQGRFRLVERANLDSILLELELGQKDLADPRNAVRVGKLALAEMVLVGSVYERQDSVEIFAQLIDTESSEILLSKDVYEEDKSMISLRNMVEGLALKFKQALPVVEGEVVEVKEQTIYTDLGKQEKLRPGMRLLVFREGKPKIHPRTGRNLGSETVDLAEAIVSDVYDEMSVGSVVKGSKQGEIQSLDRIITK